MRIITRSVSEDRREPISRASLTLRVTILAIVAVLLSARIARGDSDDEQFLSGLRARRIFSLAESYCRDRLQDQELSAAERATLTIELIRSYAGHAVNSSPAERDPHWQSAHETAEDFSLRQRDNPQEILVRVQDALTYLAHGELVRQEMEAGSRQAGAREQALAQLREAAKRLEEIDELLTKEIPRRGPPRDDGELSAAELTSLQNNVRFQLARAYRNRAVCYDKESIDRIDALTRVLDQHAELATKLSPDDPLTWQIRVDAIRCQRLLGSLDDARQRITALQSEAAPADVLLDVRAEEVRLQLAAGRPQDALSILQRGREIDGQISAELDFAQLETFDALAKATEDNDEAAEWQKRAVAMRRVIEQTHGPYWGRRANLLLVRSATSTGVAHDLEILISLANEAYLNGQFDAAVESYDKAALKAQETNNVEQSFALSYKAALVRQQRKEHAEATRRLRELALAMETQPNSSAAHLLAAWNAYQSAKDDAGDLNEYTELLEEQIATWPSSASADQARLWLAQVREREQAWTEALDVYLEVSPEHPSFAAAVASAARCAARQFDQVETNDQVQETAERAKLTAQRFEALIRGADGRLPDEWTAAQQTAAVSACQLRLQFTTDGHRESVELLEAALAGSPDAPQSWRTSVRSLLVVAYAGQGEQAKAGQAMREIAEGDPQQLLDMLLGLAAIAQNASPTVRVDVARLQLQAADLLAVKQAELSEPGRLQFELARAAARAAAGQRDDALAAYATLAAKHKSSGPIQEAYGEALLEGDDRDSLQRALDQWRVVDRGARPRSDRWYRAKYSIALAHFKLSQHYQARDAAEAAKLKSRAAELLEYLKNTPPGWENTELRDEFERLLAQCQR